MNQNAIVKAEILSQALPYIQKYHDKIVVIKYGGNAMINEELKMNVIQDVVLLSEIGVKVILVHGGGPAINQTLKKMNIESKFIHGLRYTDDETIDVVQMVLAGKTNKDLVKLIMQKGGNAVGISGIDNQLIVAKKHESEDDLGYVGEDGLVYLLGRKGDVINMGGLKIAPTEIEEVVVTHEKIKDCACIPIKDEITGEAPKLFVVMNEGCEFDQKEIAKFMLNKLEAFKVPKVFEVIDEIPRTFNGKIIRKKLKELDMQ